MNMLYRSISAMVMLLPALSAAELQMQPKRVAIFQNESTHVMLQGVLPDARQVELKGMPVLLEGSFWWQVSPEVGRVQTEGCVRPQSVPKECFSPAELLAVNVGKKVRVTTDRGDVYEGAMEPLPVAPAVRPTYKTSRAPESPRGAILKTSAGQYVNLAAPSIASVVFLEEAPNLPTVRDALPELKMMFEKAAPGAELQVECLARGLSWRPSYRLDCQDDAVVLRGKALIVNEMMNLDDVTLELISGNPSGDNSLAVSALVRGRYEGASLEKRSSVDVLYESDAEDDDEFSEVPSWGKRTRTGDVYRYVIPHFQCREGSAVARELFTHTPSCRHVYECEVDLNDTEPSVYHKIWLTNTSDDPWSPGVVVVYAGGQYVAQTRMEYTAPGQELGIELAEVSDISVSVSEQLLANAEDEANEAADDDNDEDDGDDEGYKVYIGKITICNKTEREVEFKLTKQLSGSPTAASDSGEMLSTPGRKKNPDSSITWRIKLAPGETRVCAYTYRNAP